MTKTEEQVWKDIPGYEGRYQVSDLGSVRSIMRKAKKIRRPSLSSRGYYALNLRDENGKIINWCVHRLVAMTFLNFNTKCSTYKIVDHINNVRTDNRLYNLQVTTVRHNSSKDRKEGTSKYTGVSWHKQNKKWHAAIRVDGKSKHLGYFRCETKAALLYQIALWGLQGNKNQIMTL